MPLVPALRNPVGTHVTVGSGLLTGLLPQARAIGAESLQLFVHAPYLVNLGSPTATTYERSVASVAHNLKQLRATAIGSAA